LRRARCRRRPHVSPWWACRALANCPPSVLNPALAALSCLLPVQRWQWQDHTNPSCCFSRAPCHNSIGRELCIHICFKKGLTLKVAPLGCGRRPVKCIVRTQVRHTYTHHECMSVWESCRSIQDVHHVHRVHHVHSCGWRLVPTKPRESTGAGTSPLPITPVTICAEAFLVKMMHPVHQERRAGSPARVNQGGGPPPLPDTSKPHCTHVSWHVLTILVQGHLPNLQCHPTYSIPSRPYHLPFCLSVWCQIRIESISMHPFTYFQEVLEVNMP